MAAVASLQTELRSLGHSSKRHNVELSQASEKSLSILEAVSQSFGKDQEIIPCLRKYDEFFTPFILACSEASAKSCASALQCIQTLATYKAIAPSRLEELLKALMEATQLGLGIQLKILQVLPVLLFEFAEDLTGKQVVDLLHVCAELLKSNKVAMVHNAAYATLQQLITGVFDRTELGDAVEESEWQTVTVETASFKAPPRLHDATMIWLDLCDIAEKRPSSFLKMPDLSVTFILELLELTLSNQAELIRKHDELVLVLKARVIPLMLRLFSEVTDFPVVLRVVRVFYLLLRQHLAVLTTESEVILSNLAQGSLQAPSWRRVLCLEVLQGVLMERELFLQIFSRFDDESERLNAIETIATDFATALCENEGLVLASEISIEAYNQATRPSDKPHNPDSAINENNKYSREASQILTKLSTTATPVIEMLDRAEPPKIQRVHPYYLIIKCMNSLVDDIHRLASADKMNIGAMLSLLATPIVRCFSVSLSVAMDLDLFRLVVRAVQRMAHASGIALNRELRDEFIMLLTQYCYIPDDTAAKPWLMGRCSLCVRALFNLGYALGNQLDTSWVMITGTIFRLNNQIPKSDQITFDCLLGNNEPEYRNMNLALRKLVESTALHSDQALKYFMQALHTEASSKNELLLFKLLLYTIKMSLERFGDAESPCWPVVADIILEGAVENRSQVPTSLLNEASLAIMENSYSQDPSMATADSIDKSLTMILKTVCDAIRRLEIESRTWELQHLNTLLDKFGAKISSGWDDVFYVVLEISKLSHLELLRSAFRTLELICSDFLEKLPNHCVFSLTLCLSAFARQTADLNTSFTSTSLFWTVCDHLMAQKGEGEDIDASKVEAEGDLVELARDRNSESKRIALWLFAVSNLASVSDLVHHQQVRVSAVQIFLRLFNTHGLKLPPGAWNIAYKLIFPELLRSTEASNFEDSSEMEELGVLVINGISRLHKLFLSEMQVTDYFAEFWDAWMQFLEKQSKKSAGLAFATYSNLSVLLALDKGSAIPLDKIGQFWLRQDTLPPYSSQNPKQTADSLKELVKLHEPLKDYCDAELSLKLLTQCALFPYYTISWQSQPMSALQIESTGALTNISMGDEADSIATSLSLLNRMAISSFNQLEAHSVKHVNFDGISSWAQEKLLNVLKSLNEKETSRKPSSPKLSTVFSEILDGMNKLSRHKGEYLVPSKVSLQILSLSSDLNSFGTDQVVRCVELIFEGYNSVGSDRQINIQRTEVTIQILEAFTETVKTRGLSETGWEKILRTFLIQSVIYERSIHNMQYYEKGDPYKESALLYGSIDLPVLLHNIDLSFYCLSLLRRLGSESGVFKTIAAQYFEARVRAVLCQYVGDSTLLGSEPPRTVLKRELMFVLGELLQSSEICWREKDGIHKLVLDSMSRAHFDVLPLLQDFLRFHATTRNFDALH